jgi:hypothetical protein
VDELERGAQVRVVLQAFLDQVFDGLDVVVGRALDFLDARGVGDREVRRQRLEAIARGGVERRELADALFVGQRQQPLHFHPHARLDQPVLGKDRAQGIDLGGVAAVERGEGEERGVGHLGAGGAGDAEV